MTQSSKPTVETLLEFYQKLLASLHLEADHNGLVSLNLEGTAFPAVVKDMGERRLTLPTREVLRQGDWSNRVAFHPLAENVYRGESPVLKKLKSYVNFRLNTVAMVLLVELAEIAANKDYHEKLSPKQSGILDVLPKATDKTVKAFTKLIGGINTNSPKKLINIYLKHGGKYKGEDCSRLATVAFPVMDEAKSDDLTVFGTKFPSRKDFGYFFALMDYILPENQVTETYSYGSRSMEAPYFDALMHAYIKVARQLNKITRLFRKHLDNPDDLLIDTKWEEELANLSTYRGLIPGLEGNDGELSIEDKEKAKREQESMEESKETGSQSVFSQPASQTQQPASTGGLGLQQPAVQPTQQPAQPQPTAQPQEIQSQGGAVSWNDIMQQKQQAQQAHYQPQPQQPMHSWQQQSVAPTPPPGFAGTDYQPPHPQMQQYQQAPPDSYASHPRNRPQQQQPNYAWSGGGYAQPSNIPPVFGGPPVYSGPL